MDPDLRTGNQVSWELTLKADNDLVPTNIVSPKMRLFQGLAVKSSATSVSSPSSSSSSITLAESAQSNQSETRMGKPVSRENASTYPASSDAEATADDVVPASSNTPLSHVKEDRERLNSEGGERMRENVGLDASRLRDQRHLETKSSTTESLSAYSKAEETSLTQLDDLLELDDREFAGDAGMTFVDSLFPTSVGEDAFSLESVGDWAIDSFPELPSIHMFSQTPYDEFAGRDASNQWLQSCFRRFPLSDLRKVKLKKSTIESATMRLGGGKKGMLSFLKLVLMWLFAKNAKGLQGGSVGPAGREFDEHAAGSSARVEDKWANEILANPVLQDEGSKQEHVLRHSTLKRSEDDKVSTFGGSSSVRTHPLNSSTMQDSPDHPSGSRPQPTHSFSYSTSTIESKGSSLHSVNNTKYQWSASEGDGGATILSSCSDRPVNPFPLKLPQALNGEREWHNYCGPSHQERDLQSSPVTGVTPSSFGGYVPTTNDTLGINTNTAAAAFRAARMNRMERRKWSNRRQQRFPIKATPGNMQWPYPISGANNSPTSPGRCQKLARSSLEIQQAKKSDRNLRLLFQKELKQSDVGNLGRIVVPKAAETSLPPIDLRNGVTLVVEDLNSSKVWNMRYRFWPNNKSRMYLLENTGDFIKSYKLEEGDYMYLYINTASNKYMIRGENAKAANAALPVAENAFCNEYGILNNVRTEATLTNLDGSYCMEQSNRLPFMKQGTPVSDETRGGSVVEPDDSFIADLEQSLENGDDT